MKIACAYVLDSGLERCRIVSLWRCLYRLYLSPSINSKNVQKKHNLLSADVSLLVHCWQVCFVEEVYFQCELSVLVVQNRHRKYLSPRILFVIVK